MGLLVHDRMVIDPPYRGVLEQAGLCGVGAVLRTAGDHLAAWSRTSDTIRVDVPGGGAVFVKRYHFPRWRQRLRGAFRGTFFQSHRARSEYRILRRMRGLGIAAVRPIAFGERRIGRFLQHCFLITEGVPDSKSLSTFVQIYGGKRSVADQLPPELRRRFVRTLARQVRQMHDVGFVHRDLFWRNVLVRALPGAQFEFYFLDASVSRRIRIPQRRQEEAIRDLAAMGVLAGEFCSRTDRLRFIHEYFSRRPLTASDRYWLTKIAQHAAGHRRTELTRLRRGSVFERPAACEPRADSV